MASSINIRDCARISLQWKGFSKKLSLGYIPLILATDSLTSDGTNIMLDNAGHIVNQLYREAESSAKLSQALSNTAKTLRAACVSVGGENQPITDNIDAIFIFIIERKGPLLLSKVLDSEFIDSVIADLRDKLLNQKYPSILDALIKAGGMGMCKSGVECLLDCNIDLVI